jgi:hypothetical protein
MSFQISDNATVGGDFTVDGTTVTLNTTNMDVEDTHIYLSTGYTTAAGRACGLVFNYLPTATTDTIAGTGFSSSADNGGANSTVVTSNGSTFSAGDIIQISGAVSETNNGLFEVDR